MCDVTGRYQLSAQPRGSPTRRRCSSTPEKQRLTPSASSRNVYTKLASWNPLSSTHVTFVQTVKTERLISTPARESSAETCFFVCIIFMNLTVERSIASALATAALVQIQIHGAVTAGGWTTRNVGQTYQFRNREDRRASYSVSMWWASWWVAWLTDTCFHDSKVWCKKKKKKNTFHVFTPYKKMTKVSSGCLQVI